MIMKDALLPSSAISKQNNNALREPEKYIIRLEMYVEVRLQIANVNVLIVREA